MIAIIIRNILFYDFTHVEFFTNRAVFKKDNKKIKLILK